MKGQATHLHFYDSASPRSIPSGVHAGVYINGFAWSKVDKDRMAKIFSISVEREASWADRARCIDIESGAAEIADAVPFVRQRKHLGFNDATVYTNRSNREEVGQHLKAAGLTAFEWCATLDGTVFLPSVAGLHLWAIQYQGGMQAAFDVSVLLGPDNFHKP